ncbi:MAG: hypothetical protein ACYTEZ_06665 [Planctomycetota bacterium]
MIWRLLLVAVALLPACEGSSSSGGFVPRAHIELSPTGQGWAANPVVDGLDEVSNNGAGYTGEIDLYEITTPGPGRLQVSLQWEHNADYDVILAADAEGRTRLTEGIENDSEPEYVGIPVAGGQTIYLLVAGWEGEPGPYVLETILLHPGAPEFALATAPDLEDTWPANLPLTFTFNVELDPAQDVDARVFFACLGRFAEGTWCIDGTELTFDPRLPSVPGDPGGLGVGDTHTLQFPRAARGLRATTGEYLTDLFTAIFDADEPVDLQPDEPPRVQAVSPTPGLPWDGSPITLVISEALDPDTVFPLLYEVDPAGRETPISFVFTLTQQYACGSSEPEVRLSVAPDTALRPGSILRLRLPPGEAVGLGGPPTLANALTGPAPQPGGRGFQVDFTLP